MPEPTDRNGLAARLAALVAAGLAATIAWRYPLLPWLAFLVLAAYAAALWRWPLLWLVAVPAALPALDLGPWSGWTFIEEPDVVALASVAVLLLRAPPRRGDFRLAGIPGLAVALAAASCLAGVGVALARTGLGGASAIAELSPLDPLRVAKGLGVALLLLPFLRRAFRERADAPWLFAVGMALGLGAVAAAALAERVLFVQLFDFGTMYRVVGPFSSMHFGGGYIGAYVAMALPFLFVPAPRGRRIMAVVSILIAVGALYTLVVTYSRAAYASALIAGVAAGAGQLFVALRGRIGVRALALPAVLLVAVGAAVATAATDARFMEWRLGQFRPDLDRRVREWRAGLALGDPGAAAALFGMGLGSYARTVLARRPGGRYPTDVVLGRDGTRPFVRVAAGLPLYLGQKVFLAPSAAYRFSALLRARAPARLLVILCDKLLLYSTHCRDVEVAPAPDGTWQRVAGTLPSGGLGRRVHGLARPVELALFVPGPGAALDIADVRLVDEAGRAALANGDFAAGLARWLPTDDDHAIWRIENQYLMTFFEEGALGVAAFLLLAAVAAHAAGRALERGDTVAPALLGTVLAVLASGLFDCLLEVPRLATLFNLAAFAALTLGTTKRPSVCDRAA